VRRRRRRRRRRDSPQGWLRLVVKCFGVRENSFERKKRWWLFDFRVINLSLCTLEAIRAHPHGIRAVLLIKEGVECVHVCDALRPLQFRVEG